MCGERDRCEGGTRSGVVKDGGRLVGERMSGDGERRVGSPRAVGA